MRTLTPINTNILIRLDSPPAKTAGGLHLPDMAKKNKPNESAWGLVVAVGNKVSEEVREGSKALVPPHMGTHYQVSGQDFIVLEERHVLAVQEV